MKQKILCLLAIFFIPYPDMVNAQSCANYSVARATGITYNSISASSPSYFAWRNTTLNQDDDNRSYQEPIGFDFWYLGVRYTQFSGNLNGAIDFSSSTSDGNNGGTGPYGPNYYNAFSTANQSMLTLAPFYDDLWTAGGGTTPVASSVFYKMTGTAPNRILTVEWKNFDKWNSSIGSINFQVKIYETTGKIEFLYGSMTAGTLVFTYACGINGNWTTGAPTAAVLLTQQTANTTTFNATANNSLSTLPATNSKITFTPPVPNGTPTNISFTAISKLGMTLHWTDNATNEVGYAIYHSIDNIDFIYAGETAANATSAVITGLLPSTTYYWQVHAVTEGDLGTALTGTQATLVAGNITSIATGNWSSTATWDCHCIPTLGDDITIANGHTVTLDINGVCNVLTVGQGVSGSLIIGNNATTRTLTVDSDIVIHTGAIITTGATAAIHSIILDDDIINSGTLDLAPTATRVCNITFNNDDDSDQVVSGSGTITNFNKITVIPASSANKIEITSTHFTAATNFLTLSNGIFKLSSAATVTPFTGNVTMPISTAVWLNHPGATLSTTGGTITLLGSIQATAGIFNIGNATDNNLTFDGGSLIMDGGTMNIAGRLDNLGITALTNFTMTSGALTVAAVGSTTAGIAPFSITEAGSAFNISGGTIIIRKPGAGNLGYVNTGGTNGTVTGGTVQIGDPSTPASQTFLINSSIIIPNLVVSNGVAVTAQLATNPLTVKNNISINAGTLNSNSLNITLGGHWTNNAAFTAGIGTVTFNGTAAQTIGGTSTISFNNLTINKTSGLVTLNTNVTVNAVLGFTSGKIQTGSNSVIIPSTGTVTGAGQSTGWIIGNLKKNVATGSSVSRTFDIGDANHYSPATVLFASVSTTGDLTGNAIATDHSQIDYSGLDSAKSVNRFWSLTNAGIVFTTAASTFNWVASDLDAGTTTANFKVASFNGTIWALPTIASPLSTSIQATGLIGFGDYTIGERISLYKWTGQALTSDWGTAKNWSGGVPTITFNTLIPTGITGGKVYPVLNSGTGAVNNLTIESAASLTVSAATLQIAGTISNSGIFTTTNGTIAMIGPSSQTIPANVFTNNNILNLIISNKVTLAGQLNLTGAISFGANNDTLHTGGFLTLKSTATGTSRLADITNGGANTGNYISGNVTIERYIPSRRSWRLLTAPLTNTGSIYNSWQNGGIYTAGAGTLVTSPVGGNGIDKAGNASMYTFTTSTQKFTTLNNTNANLSAANSGSADNTGYMTFVRGDRNVNNYIVPNSNSTTLSASGKLQTGTQAFAAASVANNYALIGNPYASPIDLNNITRSNLIKRFYVWDPALNTVGGFVILDDLDNDGIFTSSINGSLLGKDIQSGQAFFVQTMANGAAALTINENSKSSVTNNLAFRPETAQDDLRTDLYLLNPDNSIVLADGILAQFNDNYSDSVNWQDALKFNNINEGLSFSRYGKELVIERRPVIASADTMFLKLINTTQRSYRYVFTMHTTQPNLTATLQDSYTGNNTMVNMNGSTTVNFSINATPASAIPNRFRMIFNSSMPLPVSFTSIYAHQVNSTVDVSWKVASEINVAKYEVQHSIDGKQFTAIATVNATGNNTNTYTWLDKKPATGNNYYRIVSIDNNGKTQYSSVVKSTIGKNTGDISVYPNPVTGNTIGLLMNNMPAGMYNVRLLNAMGETIQASVVNHATGSATETILLNKAITKGVYQLEIQLVGGSKTSIKILCD